jgi:hypothetical protein
VPAVWFVRYSEGLGRHYALCDGRKATGRVGHAACSRRYGSITNIALKAVPSHQREEVNVADESMVKTLELATNVQWSGHIVPLLKDRNLATLTKLI